MTRGYHNAQEEIEVKGVRLNPPVKTFSKITQYSEP